VTRLLGALIAGGRSSRFGSDKALACWRGKPLIDHAADALRPHVEALVVCGRAHGGLTMLADRPAPDMGPLGGLNAALHHARANGFDAVLTVGCDTPLLPDTLAGRLSAAASGAACLSNLPVIGRWPAALADRLDAFLAEDRKHSIRAWAAEAGAEVIEGIDLPNVNRPEDLAVLTGQNWYE
jgi:molybdopterin-guanine dinucleotide biosynthesis protein A